MHNSIEVVNQSAPRGRFRVALFDFDGTLSLIREGWQGVMIPMMVDVLRGTPKAEAPEDLEEFVRGLVARTTGQQTIYQMMELARQVAARGGDAADPTEYKRRYNGLLMERIGHRREGLRSGRIAPADMLVAGAVEMLSALRERGIRLYCASGTDEADMREEAEMLGIAGFFDGGLYGAVDDLRRFSKAMLIGRIIREHGLAGPHLVTFGDGYVEIENTKEAGGVAVGVASDEARRKGVDAWKRARLIEAGADVIVPDFRDAAALVGYLFAESAP